MRLLQKELGERVDVSRQAIIAVETGRLKTTFCGRQTTPKNEGI